MNAFLKIRNINLFLFFLLTGINYSCERKLKKQPDLQSDRIFVTCFISPQDTTLVVRVFNLLAANTTYTSPQYDYDDPSTWSDPNKINTTATVVLSDGTNNVSLTYSSAQQAYLADASMLSVNTGTTCYLEVSAPSKRSVTAQCKIPNPAAIVSTRLDSTNEFGYVQYFAEGSFQDNEENGNAYYSFLESYSLFESFSPPYDLDSSSNSYSWGDAYGVEFVTDENKNSNVIKQKTASISSSSTYPHSLFYVLYSVDQNYLKYYQWMKTNENNGPFTQPSLIYTNINNGLGVFAGYNKTSRLIRRVEP